jgi:hypothetical protein
LQREQVRLGTSISALDHHANLHVLGLHANGVAGNDHFIGGLAELQF